jgi:hypothetical protein
MYDELFGYEKDENGMYPNLVAAYRLKGENFWRLDSYPAPFEKVSIVLEARGINPEEICCIRTAMAIRSPELAKHFSEQYARSEGWKTGIFDKLWYAPSQNIPIPTLMESASSAEIKFSILSIYVGHVCLKIKQDPKNFAISFDDMFFDFRLKAEYKKHLNEQIKSLIIRPVKIIYDVDDIDNDENDNDEEIGYYTPDEEDSFIFLWLRENVLTMPNAKEIFEKYRKWFKGDIS